MKLFGVICALTSAALILASANLCAEIIEQQIDRACLKQAIMLVNELRSEVYVDMNSTQSNKILKLAAATCRAQFNQTKMKQSIAVIEPEKNEQAGRETGDWFTDHILSGEVSDKAGNKRLKRRGQ